MNLNQHYLARYLKVSSDCPVSPNRLDELIKAALDAGALGAKLSGSGGGGAMVALCHPDDVDRVAEAIRRVGGYPYVTKVADKGLRMEYFEG
jgi:mevalonate kinase